MKIYGFGVLMGGLVLAAVAAVPASAAPTAETVKVKSCGFIGLPQTDSGAFTIRALGTSCATAGAVAVGSKGLRGAAYSTLAFHCPKGVPSSSVVLRSFAYTCKRPGGAVVKFVATW